MTNLVIHPRAAPSNVLRIWVGLFDVDGPMPELRWKLNGKDVPAKVVRQLTPAHKHGSQALCGVFDIALEGNPGILFHVRASIPGGSSADLRIKAVPPRIPSDNWVRILLISCYHQAEDRTGLAAKVYQNIAPAEQPDVSLLMGDQVYLDLPTIADFPDNEAELSRNFERNYRKNWTSGNGLAEILDAAPSISGPDDHEYWNNFPHRSPIIQNSWDECGRARWKNAADQLYDAFQAPAPLARGQNVELDINPLSLIVLDQRSQRRSDRSASLASGGLDQLNNWVDRVIANEMYGVVVTGQSLLDAPVGRFAGRVKDWSLSNYADYEAVLNALVRLADHGRPVLLLTGDVHWGRVSQIRHRGLLKFIEVICSPTSLVSTLGSDQLSAIGAGFRRFFLGEETRWPRHSEADCADKYFAQRIFGKKYDVETIYKHQGNQLAMLGFRYRAGALETNVTYYEVHKSPKPPVKLNLGPLRQLP